MSRCYALTKGFHPCRNYGEILSCTEEEILYAPTCKKHKGYDFKQHLHANAQGLEWDSIYYNYYKRVLEDGVLEITQEDIEGLPRGNYTHFMLLCCYYVPEFHFNWNRNRSLATLSNLLWQNRSVGPIYVSKQDVIRFASSCKLSHATLINCLGFYPSSRYSQPTEEEWYRFMDYYFDTKTGKMSLASPTLYDIVTPLKKICQRTEGTVMLEMINTTLVDYLKKKKKEFYLNQKNRMDPIKEELMAVTWHPERFMNWCLDQDGKEFFGV